jgi:hypothetical protein
MVTNISQMHGQKQKLIRNLMEPIINVKQMEII